ncbi:N/A [soil metagenome]
MLVVRPGTPGMTLCDALAAEGATGIHFPTVAIRPAADPEQLQNRLNALAPVDLAIFVSPNAVAHGAVRVRDLAYRPRIAAIGRATARALNDTGLQVDVQPAAGATSEALLDTPALGRVAGLTVAILRGGEGRQLLAKELTRRGANVHAIDVYVRALPYVKEHDIATLNTRWCNREIDIITATSVETLANLHSLIGRIALDYVLRTPLLTSSARIAVAARGLGHRGDSLIATGPDVQSLVTRLRDWRNTTAGTPG